jgi:hypothetical protein
MHANDENYVAAFLKIIINQKPSIDTTINPYPISFFCKLEL